VEQNNAGTNRRHRTGLLFVRGYLCNARGCYSHKRGNKKSGPYAPQYLPFIRMFRYFDISLPLYFIDFTPKV
jgi:hypothetical protein